MKLRVIECQCGSSHTFTKEILDPESDQINHKAILGCHTCSREWQGLIGRSEVIQNLKKHYTEMHNANQRDTNAT